MTAPIDRAALRALLAKATPGPWSASWDPDAPSDDVRVCYLRDGHCCEWCIAIAGETVDGAQWTPETLARWQGDAALIAAAVNALPELLDALEAEKLNDTFMRERLAAAEARVAELENALESKAFMLRLGDGKINEQADRVEAQHKRIAALESALAKYGRHAHRCTIASERWEDDGVLRWKLEDARPCDCGWEAVRSR